MGILEEIRKRKVFCDGGMGSLLQARGLKPGELPGDMECAASGDFKRGTFGIPEGRAVT